MTGERSFEPSTLRGRLLETTERALKSGALEPIATRSALVEESGVRFVVRILERLERKRQSKADQERVGRSPFLPYEPELFVADVSATHIALLNKFNVMDNHLLVVTRCFEEQESLLTGDDFEAMWRVMPELDSLLFYNAGTVAGASQTHKHLQLVPFPLGEGPERFPLETLCTSRRYHELPFRCHFSTLDDCRSMPVEEAARATRDRYLRSLAALGRENDPHAYNLLATLDWMLLVPRRQKSFESIEVNALGFAGAFLVKDEVELERLRRTGPMAVLREVAL